jgi:hypothetical protein
MPAQELLGCFLIPSALDHDVQDVAILIHGSPTVMEASVDFEEYFVEVPSVARSRRLVA